MRSVLVLLSVLVLVLICGTDAQQCNDLSGDLNLQCCLVRDWEHRFSRCKPSDEDGHWSWQPWAEELDRSGTGCHINMPESLRQSIKTSIDTLYPEGSKLTSGLTSDEMGFTPLENGANALITYFDTGAWNFNSLGLYYRDPTCNEPLGDVDPNTKLCHDGIRRIPVFVKLNSNNWSVNRSCLDMGDTISVPVQNGVEYGIYLFSNGDQQHEGQEDIFYSNVKFNEAALTSRDNIAHATWVHVESIDTTIFGFEDKVNGDYDYNDVMFTIAVDKKANFTNRPIQNEDGSVTACVPLRTVTTTSYLESQCFGYALLEASEPSACSLYLKPPTGWEVVNYNTDAEKAEVLEAITKSEGKWGSYDVFGVLVDGKLVGINRNGQLVDDPVSYEREYEEDVTCYGVKCEYRAIIKRQSRLNPCRNAGGSCVDTTRLLSAFPSEYMSDFAAYPESSSFFIKTGEADYSYDITSTVVFGDGDVPIVDIVYVVDRLKLTENDANHIISRLKDLYMGLNGRFDYRIALGTIGDNGIFTTRPFNSAYNYDEARSLIKEYASSSNRVSESHLEQMVKHNFAWRANAFKVVYFLTSRQAPTSFNAFKSAALTSNVALAFGKVDSDNGWDTYVNNFDLAAYKRYDKDKDANRYHKIQSGFTNFIRDLYKRSVLVLLSSPNSINSVVTEKEKTLPYDGSFQENPIKVTHKVTFTYASKPVHGTDKAVFHLLGRGSITAFFYNNNAPTAEETRVTVIESGRNYVFKLGGHDIDGDNLKVTLGDLTSPLPEGAVLEVAKKPGDVFVSFSDYDANDAGFAYHPLELRIRIEEDTAPGDPELSFTVDDGCVQATSKLSLYINCEGDECLKPTCQSTALNINKRDISRITLHGSHPQGVRTGRYIESVRVPGYFFNDQALQTETVAGEDGIESVFYYSEDVYGEGVNSISYRVFVIGNQAINSTVCTVILNVNPSNDPPEYNGDKVYTTLEDQSYDITFNQRDFEFETPSSVENRLRFRVDMSTVTVGSVTCCDAINNNDCSAEHCNYRARQTLIRYTPRPNDYGNSEDDDYKYEDFKVQFGDWAQNDENRKYSTVDVTMNVVPVNDAPTIEVDPSIIVGGENAITKGSTFTLEWTVRDIDNLPAELDTVVTVVRISRNPWELEVCSIDAGEEVCEAQPFAPTATINSITTRTVGCENAAALKAKLGNQQQLQNCYATFKTVFVPDEDSFAIPYVRIDLTGYDRQENSAYSETKRILVSVRPINLPPVVAAPEEIVSPVYLVNIRDNGTVITVEDDAPEQWIVTLNMSVAEGNGHFVIPKSSQSKCTKPDEEVETLVCSDTISGFSNWLKEVQFNITSGKTANLTFIANDNGFPMSPTHLFSEEVTTLIRVEEAIIPPTENDNTMTIVAGSVGAAAALGLGLAVFALRKKFGAPSNDYFDLATQTVDAAPNNPLYEADAQTVENRMYNPNANKV